MKQILISCLSLCIAQFLNADTLRVYHIGNSLTYDARTDLFTTPFASVGKNYTNGWHIACGRSLTYMVNNPDWICVEPIEPYGTFANALLNYNWDIITLQPHSAQNATTNDEIESASVMINMATSDNRNQDCIFYIYYTWPRLTEVSTWKTDWNFALTDPDSTFYHAKSTFDHILSSLQLEFPDLDIRLIPTGIVLAAIDQKLAEVNVGDFNGAPSLYRDNVHMSYYSGRYIAHVTMASTLLGISPYDLQFNYNIDAQLKALSNEVINSILSQRKIIIPDVAFVDLRRNNEQIEISFNGKLEYSHDLAQWFPMISAVSPERVVPTTTPLFYRAADLD